MRVRAKTFYDWLMLIPNRFPHRAPLAVLALAGALALPAPAHAFWGALAKLGGAGKAAGTVGKGAAVGVLGAEGAAQVAARGAGTTATLADDAARMGSRSAGEYSAVNAALPPEVAAYLNKPAKDLTPRDTAAMMSEYQRMVERAGRTGDFSTIERAPNSMGTSRTLNEKPSMVAPAGANVATVAPTSGGLPPEAVRLLAHAASSGHREAQRELDAICTPGAPAGNRVSAQLRFSPEFMKLCETRSQKAQR
ncbi:hypothetical protein WKW79_06985 [Variovorax robiniae]|uniref:Uncharacterized protein n=1 Tax=Variovorax robiniae TaxID=1836199 RepID=A0ABU8X3D9_9BURK